MVDQELRFIAKWIDKGLNKGAADAEKSVSALEAASSDLKAGLIGATAIAGSAAVAFKQIYAIQKEGAALELNIRRFDLLAQSMGINAEVLKGELNDAIGGLLTQADQVALATQIMGLGLTKNADQTVRLAKVVSQLGADMNQVTLTLTNQTTMRFDQIGIAVAGFDERLQALIDTGMNADDAFTEAFLQQGEAQIAKVGSIAETTAGQLQIFENRYKDMWNNVKIAAAAGAGPAITYQNRLTAVMDEGYISWAKYKGLLAQFARGDSQEAIRALEELEAQQAADIKATTFQREEWEKLGITYGYVVDDTEEVADAQLTLAEALDAANLGLSSQIDKWKEQIKFVDKGGEAFEQVAQSIKDDYTNGLITAESATEQLRSVQLQLMRTMGDFQGQSFDQIANQLQKLGYPLERARLLAAGLYAELQKIDGKKVTATITVKTVGGVSVEVDANTLLPTVTSSSGAYAQQAGGDFIVPPSYTGDSFPVRATAGERVTTQTASNTKQDELAQRIRRKRENQELANMIADAILIRAG